jgi:hypothetical protein
MIAIVGARSKRAFLSDNSRLPKERTRGHGTLTMIERRSENEETGHGRPGFSKAY